MSSKDTHIEPDTRKAALREALRTSKSEHLSKSGRFAGYLAVCSISTAFLMGIALLVGFSNFAVITGVLLLSAILVASMLIWILESHYFIFLRTVRHRPEVRGKVGQIELAKIFMAQG